MKQLEHIDRLASSLDTENEELHWLSETTTVGCLPSLVTILTVVSLFLLAWR